VKKDKQPKQAKHPRLSYEPQARPRRRDSVQQHFVQARNVYGHLLALRQDTFVTVLEIEGISYD
jgi:hypothetical protein